MPAQLLSSYSRPAVGLLLLALDKSECLECPESYKTRNLALRAKASSHPSASNFFHEGLWRLIVPGVWAASGHGGCWEVPPVTAQYPVSPILVSCPSPMP